MIGNYCNNLIKYGLKYKGEARLGEKRTGSNRRFCK
jgi:hypothetical protein